jgi:hypothetical protein
MKKNSKPGLFINSKIVSKTVKIYFPNIPEAKQTKKLSGTDIR